MKKNDIVTTVTSTGTTAVVTNTFIKTNDGTTISIASGDAVENA
jgi:hypothetical protein